MLLERDDPRLDVEVAAELLPDHVDVASEDEIRAVDRLAGGLAPRTPVPLQGEGAEHDRLGRSLRARTRGLARGVEETGENPDAALLDLCRARVLGVVDEVAVEVGCDEPLRLGLHPGGYEGGKVPHRIALEGQILRNQPQRVQGRHPDGREGVVGNRVDEELVPVAGGQCPVDLGCGLHHQLLSSAREVRSNRVRAAAASLDAGDMPTAEERSLQ